MSAAGPRGRPDLWLARAEGVLATALVAAVLVIMAVQVAARLVFDTPLLWPEELARLCLIWLTFIGAGHAMARGRHLAVDALYTRVGGAARTVMEVAGNLVTAACCAAVLGYGAVFLRSISGGSSAALEIPLYWFYGATLLGLALVGLHAAVRAALAWARGADALAAGPDGPGAHGGSEHAS